MLIPNNSAIPSTSTKLNFYLAQINRNISKNSSSVPKNYHNVKSTQHQPYMYNLNLA